MQTPYSYQSVVAIDHQGPICVMDAHCALCARGARWISRNDRSVEFRIVPLQSSLGRALMEHYELDPDDPVSWLLIVDGLAYSASDAVVRTAVKLGGGWRCLGALRIIPQRLLDALYYLIARNRIRWFGRADLCRTVDFEVQRRLLQ